MNTVKYADCNVTQILTKYKNTGSGLYASLVTRDIVEDEERGVAWMGKIKDAYNRKRNVVVLMEDGTVLPERIIAMIKDCILLDNSGKHDIRDNEVFKAMFLVEGLLGESKVF